MKQKKLKTVNYFKLEFNFNIQKMMYLWRNITQKIEKVKNLPECMSKQQAALQIRKM